jgi:hypothetical protein
MLQHPWLGLSTASLSTASEVWGHSSTWTVEVSAVVHSGRRTRFKSFRMEVSVARPMPPKSSTSSAGGGDPPSSTFHNSEYTTGRASAYAEGPRSSDSGQEPTSQRQTEMKLMAMELGDDLPPERVQDYKGRIRVRDKKYNVLGEPLTYTCSCLPNRPGEASSCCA